MLWRIINYKAMDNKIKLSNIHYRYTNSAASNGITNTLRNTKE